MLWMAQQQVDHVTAYEWGRLAHYTYCSVSQISTSTEFTSMDTPQGTQKWLFYTFLGMIADALDVVLISVIPDKTPQRSIVVSKFYSLTLLHPPALR